MLSPAVDIITIARTNHKTSTHIKVRYLHSSYILTYRKVYKESRKRDSHINTLILCSVRSSYHRSRSRLSFCRPGLISLPLVLRKKADLPLFSAPYIPCLILSSPQNPVSPVFTYCITFCQKQKEARGEDRLSYRDSSFRGPETAILFHTLSDLKRHLYASASQSFCKTVRVLNVSHRRIAV